MATVKVLLELEIEDSTGCLGLDDYKEYHGAKNDLEVFELMAELEECSPLNLLVNICDAETPSRFVSVTVEERESC